MPTHNLPPSTDAPIVLFDGECVLCSSGAQMLIRVDRNWVFKMAAVQTAAGRALLVRHGLLEISNDSFVLIDNGTCYLRSTAWVRIVAKLPLPWKLGAALWLVPLPVRNWVYDLVARHRYRMFGKRDSCVMLDADHAARIVVTAPDPG